MEIYETLYGAHHPLVGVAMTSLGVTWRLLGNSLRSMEFFEESLAIQEKVYESNHPSVRGRGVGGAGGSEGGRERGGREGGKEGGEEGWHEKWKRRRERRRKRRDRYTSCDKRSVIQEQWTLTII